MSAATMSGDPTPIIAVLDIQATYSAREAAVLLGRSYSWLDQRLRQDQFIRPNGTTVQPLRTQGGCRRGRPPRDRRVRDPELSAFLWAARGGGQGSLASHPERLIRGLWDGTSARARENHQDWRAHVVSSRRANWYVRLVSGLSQNVR